MDYFDLLEGLELSLETKQSMKGRGREERDIKD